MLRGADGANSVLLGPNGVGKTMLLNNLAHHSVMRGCTVRFTTASAMLNELALRDSSAGLHRRIKHYTQPQLLCIDEVGYLLTTAATLTCFSRSSTRRYEAPKPVVLTTNKPFSEWPDVFPHAACVVPVQARRANGGRVAAGGLCAASRSDPRAARVGIKFVKLGIKRVIPN
jgi:DNA replication protein DnaC